MKDFIGIQPPRPYLVQQEAQAPLGLLYVVGGAAQAGFDASVYDGSNKTSSQTAKDVEAAHVYGITSSAVDYPLVLGLCKLLKTHHPSCKVIIGGPVQTIADRIDFTWLDSLVCGEAEEEIGRILADAVDNKLKRIYVCERPDPDFVDNPYQYWPSKLGSRVLVTRRLDELESAVLLTSRGCPHNCAFCCNRQICGNAMRLRSWDAVFADVKYLVQRGIKVLRISDQQFTARPSRVVEWCERVRPWHEKHGLMWRISSRADFQDASVFKLMSETGCVDANIGIESMDQNVLDALNKGTTVEQNRSCLEELGRAKIVRRALLMSGCPGTNSETLQKNARFVLDGNYDVISLAVCAPLPGSDIYNKPREFRCDILPHAQNLENLTFFLYGPDGLREIEPYLDLWDYPYEDLQAEVKTMRGLVRGINVANTGG